MKTLVFAAGAFSAALLFEGCASVENSPSKALTAVAPYDATIFYAGENNEVFAGVLYNKRTGEAHLLGQESGRLLSWVPLTEPRPLPAEGSDYVVRIAVGKNSQWSIYRLDTRTGKTWFVENNGWVPVIGPNKPPKEGTPPAPFAIDPANYDLNAVLRIIVRENGDILVDGEKSDLQQLSEKLKLISKRRGSVFFYRANPFGVAPPNATEVFERLVMAQVPFSLCTKEDFSEEIGPNGQIVKNPRANVR